MTKVYCPLNIYGVIRRAYKQLGGAKGVRVTLPEKSISWLSDASSEDRQAKYPSKFIYEEIRQMTQAGATAFAEDLAGLCNMQLVPLRSEGAPSPAELMQRTSALMSETGAAVQKVAAAVSDGTITEAELRDIKLQAQAVLDAGQSLLRVAAAFSEGRP